MDVIVEKKKKKEKKRKSLNFLNYKTNWNMLNE